MARMARIFLLVFVSKSEAAGLAERFDDEDLRVGVGDEWEICVCKMFVPRFVAGERFEDDGDVRKRGAPKIVNKEHGVSVRKDLCDMRCIGFHLTFGCESGKR